MRGGSIAKRYATALLGVAQDLEKVEEFYSQIVKLDQAFSKNAELKTVMESPLVKSSQKKALMAALKGKLGLSDSVHRLMDLLIDQDRMVLLPLLRRLYQDMADEQLKRVRVHVRSSAPMGDYAAKLKEVLSKALDQEVLLEEEVDKDLLGGLVVRVGDSVFDGSLKRELERIQESIAKQVVA